MLPHDFVAVIVKVMFVLSAAFMLCLSKVRAQELSYQATQAQIISVNSMN